MMTSTFIDQALISAYVNNTWLFSQTTIGDLSYTVIGKIHLEICDQMKTPGGVPAAKHSRKSF